MRPSSHTSFSIFVVSVDFVPLAGFSFVLSFCGFNLLAIAPALMAADSAVAFHSRIIRMRDFDKRIGANAEKFAGTVRALCKDASAKFRLLSLALVVVPYFTGKSCLLTIFASFIAAVAALRLGGHSA